MATDLEHRLMRVRAFVRDVLDPAVHPLTEPLPVAAHQCDDHLTPAEAAQREFVPVEPSWRWGPVWSTAWFRVRGTVPPMMAGAPVVLRFSSGTEALVWHDGAPLQGLDANRDAVGLFAPAKGGEPVDLLIEAACTQPLGATNFWWDEQETHRRWKEPRPGRLDRCEIATFDESVWRLSRALTFGCDLVATLPAESSRVTRLLSAMNDVIRTIDDRAPGRGAPVALAALMSAIRGGEPSGGRCHAVGHAHIDTAWLWPLRETRRKCLRTFATMLRLMERFPDFRFLGSQAQHYAWIREMSPPLFEQIRARVREGRWEALGAMWIEPDANLPSGESLIRQIQHGVAFWSEAFGADAPAQRLLYLPDTFGFLPALPQIMRQAGIEVFITNKMAWSRHNRIPYTTFRWRGLDGTEIITHLTPGHDYNATVTPAELRRGESNLGRTIDRHDWPWLQPFGYGDGGGGPTDWMIEQATLAEACDGLPAVTLDGTQAFIDATRAACADAGDDVPVWDGELYLELHRATYTTQAWLKQANRRAELALRRAEWLAFAGPASTDDDTVRPRLDAAWKAVLLNQFHDILPGTSIPAVYDDARRQHAAVASTVNAIAADGHRAWAAHVGRRHEREPIVVFNPQSHARRAIVEHDGHLVAVPEIPALGCAVIDRAAAPPSLAPVDVTARRLANEHLCAEFDDRGRITSLRATGVAHDAVGDGPMNDLGLFVDRPRAWDAWDLDEEYREQRIEDARPATRVDVALAAPLRGEIVVERPLGERSRIEQRYRLDAGARRLDVLTTLDWHEDHRVLRALFPTAVRAMHATCDVPLGFVERPTHRNTSWDRARFEVCAHQWMDLSQPGLGVTLLNDAKYGHSALDRELGLTLARASTFPDPAADRGRHVFTYALMVHDGDWRRAGVVAEARDLNDPLLVAGEPSAAGPTQWAPFRLHVDRPALVEVTAVTASADGHGLVVRMVEVHGAAATATIDWTIPVDDVTAVDLLERPASEERVGHDRAAGRTSIEFRPFGLVSLLVTRAKVRR